MIMQFQAEYTDTFGGEANYSWVKRVTFDADQNATNALIMRRAKAACGLSGVRGRTEDMGDSLAFRPHGSATVLFITPVY